jgi:hypothetical protein
VTESIGHVRGAIVNPKTGQPTKLFYDILSRISSDTETVIREQFPWSLSIEANQVVDTGSLVLGSSGVSSADVVTNIIHQSIPVQEWFETTVQQDYTVSDREWVHLNKERQITLPPYPSQDTRVRITKGVAGGTFSANGKKLFWQGATYERGQLPGGIGSDLELRFSVKNDYWLVV